MSEEETEEERRKWRTRKKEKRENEDGGGKERGHGKRECGSKGRDGGEKTGEKKEHKGREDDKGIVKPRTNQTMIVPSPSSAAKNEEKENKG